MATVDFNDPCAVLAALKEALFKLATGQLEVEIHTRTTDAEEGVKFNLANKELLETQIAEYQRLCDAANGTDSSRRRFAIRAGSMPGLRPSVIPPKWG